MTNQSSTIQFVEPEFVREAFTLIDPSVDVRLSRRLEKLKKGLVFESDSKYVVQVVDAIKVHIVRDGNQEIMQIASGNTRYQAYLELWEAHKGDASWVFKPFPYVVIGTLQDPELELAAIQHRTNDYTQPHTPTEIALAMSRIFQIQTSESKTRATVKRAKQTLSEMFNQSEAEVNTKLLVAEKINDSPKVLRYLQEEIISLDNLKNAAAAANRLGYDLANLLSSIEYNTRAAQIDEEIPVRITKRSIDRFVEEKEAVKKAQEESKAKAELKAELEAQTNSSTSSNGSVGGDPEESRYASLVDNLPTVAGFIEDFQYDSESDSGMKQAWLFKKAIAALITHNSKLTREQFKHLQSFVVSTMRTVEDTIKTDETSLRIVNSLYQLAVKPDSSAPAQPIDETPVETPVETPPKKTSRKRATSPKPAEESATEEALELFAKAKPGRRKKTTKTVEEFQA